MASWQNYVDHEICRYVETKLAVIASLEDGSIWAIKQTPDQIVTQKELKVIADSLKVNPKSFEENGIYLAGEKFICLRAEPNLIRGRKGTAALIIVATKSCLLVAVSVDGFPPGQLNTIVERLGDHLRQNDY